MLNLTDLIARAQPGDAVLVRSDLNAPLGGSPPSVTDETRLVASLPTLRSLVSAGLRVVLCSHLGRPTGPDPALSLVPVAEKLAGLLAARGAAVPVHFTGGMPTGPDRERLLGEVGPGEVGLLENLRFDPREKGNDPTFADELVSGLQHFVNDAFGTCHRAHASVVGVAERLPACGGLLVERELEVLSDLRGRPARPYWVILGGAKVSDKIGVVERLRDLVDGFVVGGGMANTFLAAKGVRVGGSRVEEGAVELARQLLEHSGEARWVLPVDGVVAAGLDEPEGTVVDLETGEVEGMILDIGPRTIDLAARALHGARTIFWNGPPGVFEKAPFAEGTRSFAELLADHPARVVVGGGDTAAAARRFGIAERVSHVCTGGGAALEYLEGKDLPGLVALEASALRQGPR
jgi:phosphoglycerate kinase